MTLKSVANRSDSFALPQRENLLSKKVSQGRFEPFTQEGKYTWKKLASFIYQLILRLARCLLPCYFKNNQDKNIPKEIRSISSPIPHDLSPPTPKIKPFCITSSTKEAGPKNRTVQDTVLEPKHPVANPPKLMLEPNEENTSLLQVPKEEPKKQNLAPFEKVTKRVLDHHLLPFLDARSLQSLSCTSNAIKNAVSESQKVLFHLPAQFSQCSEERRGLFRNVTTLAISKGTTNEQLHHIGKMIQEGYFLKLTKIQLFPVELSRIKSGLAALIRELPDLEAFDGNSLRHFDTFNGLTYDLISALSHCKKLKSLHINWEYLASKTLKNLDQLTKNWTELETLIYNNKRGLRTENRKFVQTLLTNCPNLKKLDLYYIDVDDAIMRMISENCPNLESLNVSGGIGDISDNVAVMTQLAKGCPRLRHFNSYCIFAPSIGMYAQESPYTLTDLLPLAEGCKNLEELYLDRVSITDAGLNVLNQFKLRSLSLYSCSNLTSNEVRVILDGQPALDELIVEYADLREPISLSKPHPLKKLVLNTVTDEASLIELLSQLPELTTLVIDNYQSKNKFSDALLIAIAKYCPNLRKLNINKGPFSQQTIATLKESNKKLVGSERNQRYGGF